MRHEDLVVGAGSGRDAGVEMLAPSCCRLASLIIREEMEATTVPSFRVGAKIR